MKRVTLSFASGNTQVETLDSDATASLLESLEQQHAARAVRLDDNRVMHFNLRQVETILVEEAQEGQEDPADETGDTEPQEQTQDTPEGQDTSGDSRTVAQLKEALDAAGIQYDPKAVKADLVVLARQASV